MKNLSRKYKFYICLIIFITVMISSLGIAIGYKYCLNRFWVRLFLGIVPAMVFNVSAIEILDTKKAKAYEAYEIAMREEKYKKLSSEFKNVQLKNSGTIIKEAFECQAKVNNDGKIICKVQLDIEDEFGNYEEFAKFFSCEDTKK